MMQKIKNYWRREPVLCIAVILAAVSSLYSRPQLAYIDFDVLAILLSLMLVVAELKEIRFLDWLAVELLNKCRSKRQLELVLLAVTYVSSMFVTNDVALLTFVPLALVIGKTLKMDMERIIILQTLAANLGSMLTPPGNPQNLFLYAHYAYTAGSFFAVMAGAGGNLFVEFLPVWE
ncbi:citrate transporter [Phascolarctobacterium succinatutens CAG:287]|uniref:Citrate transporter n=2 Tax=Phascolarctobacterium succinatutens TaxID=626940 RepID=R6Y194_9FIRM|nr:citrate transporter [Phascolarctobacterium succinatutens CAG:287]